MTAPRKYAVRFAVILVLSTAAAIPITSMASPLAHGLYDASMITGWSLLILLAALAACTWSPRRGLSALGTQLRWVALLTAFTVIVFAGHIHSFPPLGLLDRGLAAIFLLLTASSSWGFWLSIRLGSHSSSKGQTAFRTWLFAHSAILGVLLSTGIIHGLLIHCHGVMARLLDK
jgi:hypothetical protein